MKKTSLKVKKIIPFIAIFLLLSISFLTVFFSLFQPKAASNQESLTFVVPKGQAISVIGKRLEEAGLIRSGLAFRYVVTKDRLANKIQAGSFKISPSMNTWEIARALTKGTDDLWITLPEGWRREEMAASLADQELSIFKEKEFLQLTVGLEGQLFPDTYLVSKAIATEQLVDLLRNTFESKIGTALDEEIKNSKLTLNEILTFASLVQRESANEAEMPLVAGILQHRLDIEMPLQVDATLQYIKAYSHTEETWWSTPLAVDKELDSLYNTYQYAGLPPAPICNPGLAAIKAVLSPKSTRALYYLHDNAGQIHTAETLEGHNRNIDEYLR